MQKERMETYTFRLTEAQREKVNRNGGGEWLRALIQRAKVPQKRAVIPPPSAH